MKLFALLPILLFVACDKDDSNDSTESARISGSCSEEAVETRAWPFCTQYDDVMDRGSKTPEESCNEEDGEWSDEPCNDDNKVAGCRITGSTGSNPQPVITEWIYAPGTREDAVDLCGEGDNQVVVDP